MGGSVIEFSPAKTIQCICVYTQRNTHFAKIHITRNTHKNTSQWFSLVRGRKLEVGNVA
jgi:hypothetical protein